MSLLNRRHVKCDERQSPQRAPSVREPVRVGGVTRWIITVTDLEKKGTVMQVTNLAPWPEYAGLSIWAVLAGKIVNHHIPNNPSEDYGQSSSLLHLEFPHDWSLVV